jgi:SRSO17 transposase
MTRDESFRAWIIEDTGLPRKGDHSVGVARPYCSQLGRPTTWQVLVSLPIDTLTYQ